MEKQGDKYGIHRVITPQGVLTQAAQKIDNTFESYYDNEIVVNVESLNIDSASFNQIKTECNGDINKIEQKILEIVNERGKMQNPVTGSGGMFIGTVHYIGSKLKNRNLKVGDKIASLVSLSLTPLKIDKIEKIIIETERVEIKGKAILFESGIYAVLPLDMPFNLALAALDVAGAPAQTLKLVKKNDSVLVLGAAGKSGVLVCAAAKKAGAKNVVGVVRKAQDIQKLLELEVVDHAILAPADQPIDVLQKSLAQNNNNEYDVAINCVNVVNTEMATILPVRDNGIAYFFSMATSFTKSALGAEGCGKDVTMIIGNGYTFGHAETTLQIIRENPKIYELFKKYI